MPHVHGEDQHASRSFSLLDPRSTLSWCQQGGMVGHTGHWQAPCMQ